MCMCVHVCALRRFGACTRLQELNLVENEATDAGVLAVAEALRDCCPHFVLLRVGKGPNYSKGKDVDSGKGTVLTEDGKEALRKIAKQGTFSVEFQRSQRLIVMSRSATGNQKPAHVMARKD